MLSYLVDPIYLIIYFTINKSKGKYIYFDGGSIWLFIYVRIANIMILFMAFNFCKDRKRVKQY